MSRFYFSWMGNKRTEIKYIDDAINWDEYDTIVEPFCGSCALSMELFARDMKKNYVLNDIDENLIGLMNHVKENKTSRLLYNYCAERLDEDNWRIHKDKNLKVKKGGEKLNTYEYFYTMRVRSDFNRTSTVPKKWPSLNRTNKIITTDEALRDEKTIITLGDWRTCVDKYKDDSKALIFLDPPYFSSFNQEYYGMKNGIEDDGKIKDITAIFIEILEYLRTSKAKIVLITNSCSIIDYLYSDYIADRYSKTYSRSFVRDSVSIKKHTDHILVIGGGI